MSVRVPNQEVMKMPNDVLYHLDLDTEKDDLKALFGKTKFIIMSGCESRVGEIAELVGKELNIKDDYMKKSSRFVIYRKGPVLLANHAMGVPSTSIILHEMLKLLQHAGCSNVEIFRVGTSGGIGLEPGTVVVTSEAVNGLLKPVYIQHILGTEVERETAMDADVAAQLLACRRDTDKYDVISGKTMSTDDFYEGQARRDGATCTVSEEDKTQFMQKLHDQGIRNIEMEATVFGGMCRQVENVKVGVLCVTIVNRLKGDQIVDGHLIPEWQIRPAEILIRYIKSKLM